MNAPLWTPNLIVPGVAKCGTTTLYDLLVAHPRVTGGLEKEVRFLIDAGDDLETPANVRDKGLAGWADQFADRGRGDFDVWVDASPQYQYQRIALETIAALPVKPKVLFVVRDPARRLFSMYQYARYHQRTIPFLSSFPAFIEAIRPPVDRRIAPQRMLANAWADSHYAESTAPWREALPAGHLKIARIEHFAQDREGFLHDLANWLGIDPAPLVATRTLQSNETVHTRSRLVRKAGQRLAAILPENRLVRRAKDAIKALNEGAVDRDELARNADLMEELAAEFAPSMERLEALRVALDAESRG
jgi:hypothetical protein